MLHRDVFVGNLCLTHHTLLVRCVVKFQHNTAGCHVLRWSLTTDTCCFNLWLEFPLLGLRVLCPSLFNRLFSLFCCLNSPCLYSYLNQSFCLLLNSRLCRKHRAASWCECTTAADTNAEYTWNRINVHNRTPQISYAMCIKYCCLEADILTLHKFDLWFTSFSLNLCLEVCYHGNSINLELYARSVLNRNTWVQQLSQKMMCRTKTSLFSVCFPL